MDQYATWYGGMPRPRRHCVTWGVVTQLPHGKGHSSPHFFGPLWPNGWMDQDTTWHEGRPRPRCHCVRWEPSTGKGAQQPPSLFGPCLSWPNGRPSQQLLSSCSDSSKQRKESESQGPGLTFALNEAPTLLSAPQL